MRNIKNYNDYKSSVNEEELNEAVGITTLAAAAIGAGILIRLGLMSDDKLKKTVDAAKETGKEAGKALKMAGNALARELPIIGKKIKKKELTARQLGELEKYLRDEISDKDVIEAMSEDPQLKAIIEAIAAGSKTHYHFYDRIKRIKGSPWATLDKKFKTLRKKILAGEVEESVNEGDYYISTKSNVPSTWTDTNAILVDLKKFINGVGAANGADGVRDLVDVLEQVIRHAKKVEKKVN